MYDLYMNDVAVSEARKRLAEIIDQAGATGAPIGLSRRGKRAAVILSASSYESLLATAEDVEDRAALAKARAEDDVVPWDEVKAELGLD